MNYHFSRIYFVTKPFLWLRRYQTVSIMTDVYQHRQLQPKRSIRVLELAPAKNLNAPIHCKLIETSLAEGPPACLTCEALSYAWGSPHGDRQILCEGKTLLVTANCDAALRRLRNKTNSRFLWIDSICIDQSSIKEKNEQVRLMADVYALAKQVIVWLRDAGEYTTTTFLALRVLATLQNHKSSSFLVPQLAKRLALSLSECPKSLNIFWAGLICSTANRARH
jgi:hypothetical protein